MKPHAALCFLWALFHCTLSAAAQSSYSAQELFDRYREAIVLVQITNNLSGERSSLGSGFYISSEGLAVTNYHVVSAVVQNPDDYRVEIIHADGAKERPEVIGVDLINDLALLRTVTGPVTPFSLDVHPLRKGARILSLGNPNDLGMTVVNGSYSGNLDNSLYERIHFSGAINQGMSGGPALDDSGNVIGINVATSGNGVGFLIPAKLAVQLVDSSATQSQSPMSVSESIKAQLQRNQEHFMGVLLTEQLPVSTLGDYRVPDKIAPFMRCWGDSDKDKKGMYEIVMRLCSSGQDVFIDDEYSTGKIYYSHRYLRSEELNALRFSSLYQNSYSNSLPEEGDEEYLTNFHCRDDFVDNGSVNLKTSLCLRGHKKVPGLFDWVLVAASIEKNRSGVQTALLLTGVSYENGRKFVEKYLKAITWNE